MLTRKPTAKSLFRGLLILSIMALMVGFFIDYSKLMIVSGCGIVLSVLALFEISAQEEDELELEL